MEVDEIKAKLFCRPSNAHALQMRFDQQQRASRDAKDKHGRPHQNHFHLEANDGALAAGDRLQRFPLGIRAGCEKPHGVDGGSE